MYPGRSELMARLFQATEEQRAAVTELGRWLYTHPEPPGQETAAAQRVIDYLAARGFEIETDLADLPAAFRARYYHWDTEAMRKGLRHAHIGFLADLSAAPEGHSCGHQLSTVAAVVAASALAKIMPPVYFGTLSVFGCPGPNFLGGKLRVAEAGFFEPADQLYGAVPALSGQGFPPIIDSSGKTLAHAVVTVHYPDGDAASLGELHAAVADLIDQLQPNERITPTATGFVIEALTALGARAAYEQIAALAEARARSGGEPVQVELGALVNDMNPNRIVARRAKTFAYSERFPVDRVFKGEPGPPNDWGAVSYSTATLRWPFPITEEQVDAYGVRFAELSNRDEAYERAIRVGRIMATIAMDAIVDMDFRGFIENDFIRGLKERGVTRIHRRWTGVHPVQPPSGDGPRYLQPEPGRTARGTRPSPDPAGES